MYEARQNKEKVSRRIDGGNLQMKTKIKINCTSINSILQFANPNTIKRKYSRTILARLYNWNKKAEKIEDEKLKNYVKQRLDVAWEKYRILIKVSKEKDKQKRIFLVNDASANLKNELSKLFSWDNLNESKMSFGAFALYRGLHFSSNWIEVRKRSVIDECKRSLDEIKKESSYSAAVWELFRNSPSSLKEASRNVIEVLESWLHTTDKNRKDGGAKRKMENLKNLNTITNPTDAQKELMIYLKEGLEKYTFRTHLVSNRFFAELSKYINCQQEFERDLSKDKDIKFSKSPFVSTTKVPREAVKYAQGKLIGKEIRSTRGNVGKVLIYIMTPDDFYSRNNEVKGRGIDVWQEYLNKCLFFTEWRKEENEITFSGKIPERYLSAQVIIEGKNWFKEDEEQLKQQKEVIKSLSSFSDNKFILLIINVLNDIISKEESIRRNAKDVENEMTEKVELEAYKRATVFGGLKPLPINV